MKSLYNSTLDFSFPQTLQIRESNATGDYDSRYEFDRDTPSKTIHDTSGVDLISVEFSYQEWIINLRPGTRSYRIDDGSSQVGFRLSGFTTIEHAFGSSARDHMIGNGVDNLLNGLGGRNIFDGRFGNDTLVGGKDNDVYIYRPGQGNDQIIESIGFVAFFPGTSQDLGGASMTSASSYFPASESYDRINIMLSGSFDRLEQDFNFRRFGNDLRINLSHDRSRSHDGSIRIKDQGFEGTRVETLILSMGTHQVARISLEALWNQLADGEVKQFKVVPGEFVKYGSMVAPV